MNTRMKFVKLLRPILNPFIDRIRFSDLLFLDAKQKTLEIIRPFQKVFISTMEIQGKDYPIVFKRTLFRGVLMVGLDGRQYNKMEEQKAAYKEVQQFMAAGARNIETGFRDRLRNRLIWSPILLLTAVIILTLITITDTVYLQNMQSFHLAESNILLVNAIYATALALVFYKYRSMQ